LEFFLKGQQSYPMQAGLVDLSESPPECATRQLCLVYDDDVDGEITEVTELGTTTVQSGGIATSRPCGIKRCVVDLEDTLSSSSDELLSAAPAEQAERPLKGAPPLPPTRTAPKRARATATVTAAELNARSLAVGESRKSTAADGPRAIESAGIQPVHIVAQNSRKTRVLSAPTTAVEASDEEPAEGAGEDGEEEEDKEQDACVESLQGSDDEEEDDELERQLRLAVANVEARRPCRTGADDLESDLQAAMVQVQAAAVASRERTTVPVHAA